MLCHHHNHSSTVLRCKPIVTMFNHGRPSRNERSTSDPHPCRRPHNTGTPPHGSAIAATQSFTTPKPQHKPNQFYMESSARRTTWEIPHWRLEQWQWSATCFAVRWRAIRRVMVANPAWPCLPHMLWDQAKVLDHPSKSWKRRTWKLTVASLIPSLPTLCSLQAF